MKRRIFGVLISLMLAAAMLLSGCSEESAESVSVQSVAMLAGLGNVGLADQFGGIVSARSEVKIKADTQKQVSEVLVEEGDEVTAGQVLFTYDMELAQLDMEKADLELAQMQNTLASKQSERTTLENEKAKASASEQLSYTLAIQECDADIREQQYKIAVKEKEVERLRSSLEEQDCKSSVNGRVKKVNSQSSGGQSYGYTGTDGSDDAFITIVESGSYRVKGYINENNAAQLTEGLEVTICSRVNDDTWSGHVTEIDWANPQSSNSSEGYIVYGSDSGSSEMNTSNKYPFYVELDNSDGLLLGQHVYIKPGIEAEENEEIIALPEYYFFDIDVDTAYVWAENSRHKLERRKLIVHYLEELGMYRVDAGLTGDNYIAFPTEELKEGQPCQEFDDVIISDGIGEGGMFEDGIYEDGMFEDGLQGGEDINYEGMPAEGMDGMEGGFDGGVYEPGVADGIGSIEDGVNLQDVAFPDGAEDLQQGEAVPQDADGLQGGEVMPEDANGDMPEGAPADDANAGGGR